MERKEIIKIVESMIGTPYKDDSKTPDSPENGFKCYSWAYYIYKLAGLYVGELPTEFTSLRMLRKNFIKIKDYKYQYLDIPEFYMSTLETRHIGVFLNDYEFTQCSKSTNGIAINNINNEPWSTMLRRVYRFK